MRGVGGRARVRELPVARVSLVVLGESRRSRAGKCAPPTEIWLGRPLKAPKALILSCFEALAS